MSDTSNMSQRERDIVAQYEFDKAKRDAYEESKRTSGREKEAREYKVFQDNLAKARQKDEEDKAKFEKLRVEKKDAIDREWKGHDRVKWMYRTNGTREQHDKYWDDGGWQEYAGEDFVQRQAAAAIPYRTL